MQSVLCTLSLLTLMLSPQPTTPTASTTTSTFTPTTPITKTVSTKRVVHIPSPFTSHTRYHTQVARALRDMGHEVWVTVPHYLQEKGVLDTSNLTVLGYTLARDYEEAVMKILRDGFFSESQGDLWAGGGVFVELCDDLLRHSGLQDKVREVRPDLIVLDNLPQVYTLMVLPYRLRVPFVMVGTAYDVSSTRVPYSSAANPLPFRAYSDDMSFWERVTNMLDHVMIHVFHPFMPRDVVSLYAPEMPHISNLDLRARPELWLIETDHILDYPRPTLPNVKLIGGTVAGPAQPLPSRLKTFMDGATEGVVVVSFGSYVLGLPKPLSEKLFRVFQALPMKVVFRTNLTSPDPGKVFVSRWLPQNDVLGHPNTRLFLSHCGKNGQYEALYHAVPLLCTPLFGDQPYNARRIQEKGFGQVVRDIRTVTRDELHARITQIVHDPGYKAAISRASGLFRQQYPLPRQEAAWWLDHVMQYGGDYMRYAGQKMPWYQFHQLDVLAFVFGLGVLSTVGVCVCVKLVVCKCCYTRKVKVN